MLLLQLDINDNLKHNQKFQTYSVDCPFILQEMLYTDINDNNIIIIITYKKILTTI